MLKKSAFLICASLYSSTAFAACNPRDFLAQNTELTSSASSLYWSQMSDISKERFEELKKSKHLFLNLPKVPLIANIDYDDFKRLAEAEKSSQKMELNQVQTQTIYRSYLSPEAVKAYLGCVENDADHLDISVPHTALDQSDFFVTLTWMGPRGEPTGRFDNVGTHHFQIFGGEIPDQADFDKIEGVPNGKPFRVRVKRDLSVPFGFSASVDGSSGEIGLPAKENRKDTKFEVVKSADQSAYADGLSNQHNKFCLEAKGNQIFLPSTAQLVDTQNPGNGKVWTSFEEPRNEKLLCARANAEMYGGKHVGGHASLNSHIEVLSIISP